MPDLSAASGLATGSTSFDHNQFETTDATKDANADAAAGNDWSTRQTIAPENPTQSSQTATDVVVSIDAYEYTSD